MTYALRYHPRVADDLEGITPTGRARIRRAVETRLAIAPERYGVPLTGTLRGHWKLRVGDYRIVFRVARREVFVLAIVHRRDVYERASRRLR